MLNLKASTHMGAKFRLINIDTATGETVKDSGWHCNMILNNAVTIMPEGFSSVPIPQLGFSLSDEAANQVGVISPIVDMVCTANKELWAARYTSDSELSAQVSWGHRYTFKNNATSLVEISEVGIANFNRAVFRDDEGNSYSWSISPAESLIIEMEFIIRVNSPVDPVTINIYDQDDVIIKTLSVKMRACDKLTDATVPTWWRVLSEPETKVMYTTDQNFNGTIRPAASSVAEVSVSSKFTYVDRKISIALRHRGHVGGENIKGILYQFGCMAPVLTAVFDNPVYVGGGYTLDVNATVNW